MSSFLFTPTTLRMARSSVPSLSLKRALATAAASLPKAVPAALHLKSGQSFTGTSFGSKKSVWGETVFSTSITSCQYTARRRRIHGQPLLSRARRS
jgi:carbamoyl-phosphate synthase small subunit